ncbi:MAG: response regulator [Chitinivibrionales bacterium]|nr:response regulator [Chitinivibrionales bacterium]
MEVDPIITNLYRLRFRQILADRARRQAANNARPDVLFTDLYISRNPNTETPPAPQGIGEYKHAVTDEPRKEQPDDTRNLVQPTAEKQDTWYPDSAFKYIVGSGIGPSLTIRQQMESKVRTLKRKGEPCPHTTPKGACSALFIRCGDREQYAVGEDVKQRKLPHQCRYRPEKRGDYILIVDDDRAVRDFCKNSFELFFHYQGDKIETVDNGYKALDTLSLFKIADKQCGLVVVDVDMPGTNGYELVNELYDRNLNVEILLMKELDEHIPKPADYAGDREIIPQKKFVRKVLQKPFHSLAFVDSIKEMELDVFDE